MGDKAGVWETWRHEKGSLIGIIYIYPMRRRYAFFSNGNHITC